jgi:hypothetical protein
MKFGGIMKLHFFGLFGPSVVELRDVCVSILFGEEGSLVGVGRVSGGLGGVDRGGGEGDTGVTLRAKWTAGEGVEKTGSMASC